MADREADAEAAILVSGGIDSAVLCVDLGRRFRLVRPLYLHFGLRWEAAELAGLRRFLDGVRSPSLAPLVVLDEPIGDVYGDHWSVAGPGVPGAEAPDEAVYLPGRNLLLATKAAVWCRVREVETLALGSLGSNPFPDGSPDFFGGLESILNLGMDGRLRLIRPYASLSKAEVIRRGAGLPLGSTFSCLGPVGDHHCGGCNKCEERRRAFRSAGVADPTEYARPSASRPEEVGCSA